MTTQPISITPAARVVAMPTHDAEVLTGPDGLARIVLNEQVYQLRITRAGKLILTK